ncbi:phosphatidylserine decarboxylase family protein [Balneolaceae bacterium YR4-1]|uniref:Phosphatidylserine decarboxylase proenzyme n=1 Tax=Halalkalibaculum roseum TaxID=2709311 RepID=A0A6M1SVR6_9BACT|nr:phosphatidylserine decarboxylase family protein [Halalkalibaculum roseum]NGP76226.1 phosphatidylserine decarboxylase family protein [Halalkalibaculum roseum]
MIAREGYSNIAFVLVFGIAISILGGLYIDHWLVYGIYALSLILSLFILFFFRDPDRITPEDDSLIISPADGKVVMVKEVEEEIYMNSKATQISIFLSPLNVHVNRVPASGTIEYVKYHPGVYLMAWDERASSMNERADFGLKMNNGIKIFFRQITGFLARRIVYSISEQDEVKAGSRFGIMKFGSRMDVLLPDDVEISVKEGDRTVAGESVLGKIIKSDKAEAQHTESQSQTSVSSE